MRAPFTPLVKHRVRRPSAILAVLVATGLALAAPEAAVGTTAAEFEDLSGQVHELSYKLADTRSSNNQIDDLILTPVAILVSILAAGGALGIVYSVRDQRRVSQLHSLTVSSEVAGQRRIEQSYSTFLGESQKTLTLVNDTLRLAKEASDREARSMDLKAKANLDAIEAEAEDLVLQVIETGDYEEIIDKPDYRSRVQSVARRLASLEGYVVLQDIDLHPYSRLVKGVEQFLAGNIGESLHTLRHAAQDSSNRQLQRFSLYWAAKLNNAVGNYDHALHLLDQAKELFNEQDSVEVHELTRLHSETEFFQIADTETGPPDQRLRSVKNTLVKLVSAADSVRTLTEHNEDQHAGHEIAVTRADIYSWIAYRPKALCEQIPELEREAAERIVSPAIPDGTASLQDDDLEDVFALGEDGLRAWVLMQAKLIYPDMESLHSDEGIDFALIFGKAEVDFALADGHDIEEYKALEGRAIEDQVGAHREHRWTVELAQIALISKARLLKHVEIERNTKIADDHANEIEGINHEIEQLRTEVESTSIRVQNALHGAPDHTVKIFSHLQRRNLDENSFREEAGSLKAQALAPMSGASPSIRDSGSSA